MIQVKDLRKTFRPQGRKSKGATVEAVRSIYFAVHDCVMDFYQGHARSGGVN